MCALSKIMPLEVKHEIIGPASGIFATLVPAGRMIPALR